MEYGVFDEDANSLSMPLPLAVARRIAQELANQSKQKRFVVSLNDEDETDAEVFEPLA